MREGVNVSLDIFKTQLVIVSQNVETVCGIKQIKGVDLVLQEPLPGRTSLSAVCVQKIVGSVKIIISV